MDVREGDRAQSVQVGVIFLFGFLIVGLSVYQVAVVPEQNRQVEFNAYQQAAADLTDVRNDVLAAAGRDTTLGTTVKTGVGYPSRAIFVNPGPPPNRIATTGERNVSIENVEAVDGEADNARAFVADNVTGRNYATRDVRYDPNYNVLDAQPMVVTGQQAYRVAGDRPIPLASQTLVGGEEGERIHLTTIDGDLSTGGSAVPVTSDSVSASTRSTTIRSADGGDITLRLETPGGLSADGWIDRTGRDLNETYARVLNVENTTTGGGPEQVAVTLAGGGGRSYQLRLSRVEVRSADSASTVEDPGPEYVTAHAGDEQSVISGQRASITARVHDRFTNPVGDARVEFEVVQGNAQLLDESGNPVGDGVSRTITTTEDGIAPVRLVTLGAQEDVVVEATALSGESALATASFTINVNEGDTATSGSGAYLLSFRDAAADGPGGDLSGARFDVRNLADERDITITDFRVERSTADVSEVHGGGQNADPPWDVPLTVDAPIETGTYENEFDIGETVPVTPQPTLAPDDEARVYLPEFWSLGSEDMSGEYIEVTVVFEIDGETEEATATLLLF